MVFLGKIFVVFIILFKNFASTKNNQFGTRIVKGEKAKVAQFPYQVSLSLSLESYEKAHFCGGSIIDEKHVLTAAHCVYEVPYKIFVIAGTIDLQNRQEYSGVEIIIIHKDYHSFSVDNDIAVIRIETPFTFGNKIQPIALAAGKVLDKTLCVTSGWGFIDKDVKEPVRDLMYANVYIENWNKCRQQYLSVFYEVGVIVTENIICTENLEGRGVCKGDSGGPLACKVNEADEHISVVGIAAFVKECGNPLYSAGYTDVYRYANWIEAQLAYSPTNILRITLYCVVGVFGFLIAGSFFYYIYKKKCRSN